MDDYNVLGNFQNLSCANFLKNIKFNAPNPTSADSITSNDLDCEYPSDLDEIPPSKKNGKGANKLKKQHDNLKEANKNSNANSNENKEIAESSKRTTRSSRKDTSAKGLEANPKGKGSRKKKNNSIQSPTQLPSTDLTTVQSEKETPLTRGRRANRGRRQKANNQAATNHNEIIQIDEEENMNPPLFPIFEAPRTSRSSRQSNVMRARRNYFAERAARCDTVAVVDLISSPIPVIRGVIDVDADYNENEQTSINDNQSTIQKKSLEISFEEDNPELSVKILWHGQCEVFTLRKHQKFQSVFESLAERENTDVSKIFLNLNNQIIMPSDSPDSIQYKIYQFIEGRAMLESKLMSTGAAAKKRRNPNLITLKIQSDKWKRPLSIEMLKAENFKQLFIKCSEELQTACENFKLCFDGETLKQNETPNDLEFEGGETLEIYMKNHT